MEQLKTRFTIQIHVRRGSAGGPVHGCFYTRRYLLYIALLDLQITRYVCIKTWCKQEKKMLPLYTYMNIYVYIVIKA